MFTSPSRFMTEHGRSMRFALACALAVVLGGYLLQALSPIRLSSDVVTYLEMARNAAEGHGFPREYYRAYYPIGYPALVAGLVKIRLAHPWSLIVLNVVWMILAAAASWALFRRSFRFGPLPSGLLLMAWLLSWIVFKHAAMPLSDCASLGSLVAALAFMTAGCDASSARRAACFGIVAVVLTAASLALRTTGLALLPALFLTNLRYWRRSRTGSIWRLPAVALALVSLVGLAVSVPLMGIYSLAVYSGQAVHQTATPLQRIFFRTWELGGLALNLPPTLHVRLLPRIVTHALGISFALLVAAGFCVRRRLQAADAFLLSYAALLLQWPYYDERFLLPAIPFLFAYVAALSRTVKTLPLRIAAAAYLTFFIAAGLFSLSYSIWLGSLRGDRFARTFGGGSELNNYCAAFGDCQPDPSRPPADPRYVAILRFYR